MTKFSVWLSAGLLLLMAGCARVEPIDRPSIAYAPEWENAPGATLDDGAQMDRVWWRAFGSAQLDQLVAEALEQSPDLRAAEQRLRQAQWQMRATGASLYPSANLSASTSSRSSQDIEGDSRSEKSTSANAGISYELDLWGRLAAERQAARASFRASEYDYVAARLSLTGAVATAWFEYLNLQSRTDIARENIRISERVMDIVELRYRNGAANAAEVARQRTSLLSQRAQLAPLEFQERQTRRALAVLIGENPQSQRLALATERLQDLTIPEVQAGTPATLISRRPDLARAEAQLQAADANVAAARAAYLPSFSLSAGFSLGASGLFSLSDAREVSNIGMSLSQLLFDGGRTRSQTGLSESRRLELVEQYRLALLTALQETDDALGRVQLERDQEQRQREILAQAERTLRLTELRYREGSDDLLALLDAQSALFQAREQLAEARLSRLSAVVELYKALGGGWTTASAQEVSLTPPI